jgi:hypothetical protein
MSLNLFLRLVVVSVVLLPAAAFAETSGTDIGPVVTDVLVGLLALVLGVIGVVVRQLAARWLGVVIADSDTAALNAALVNGAHSYIADHVLKGGSLTVDLHNAAANYALKYAVDHEPAIAARIGQQKLVEKAQSRAATILNGLMSTPTAVPTAVPGAAPAPATT